ncbi:TPA: protein translocase SEC61 complex subunit gamma [Candidatus Woesearchaeota archaeon]|nr:hypothetical protein QT06_C0001G0072 [archaeon GW2011_AR15]MBS3104121.1 protein translocase SEC61 complex subunit gamma [Candidatus Woesearchaeota archaeon]HIH41401.1 protein translocase SEC61 complex subunit gamma [Candidatus Woesearchaeota archaeon]
MISNLKTFIIECKRVLAVTKKPDGTEFKNIFKISGMGVLLIGAVGFLLFIAKEMLI